MNISSTPFIRNDYWPDYNDIDILNKRIDEAENETSLVNSRLTNDIENVSNNLNSYKNEMADTVITNNIIVNNLNANYAVGKYANFINTNTDNAYIENLTVNKPVFDITLNTPHVENITSIGGNFYDANLFNVAVDNLFVNTQAEPVTSSAVLGYDAEGRVIPIHAAFEVGFPENANYLYTDQYGTAFKGTAETEVNASDNLITSNAVYNALANVNNGFNNVNIFVNNGFNNVNNGFNIVNNNFANIDNNFNDVNNGFNNVNNTANNLLDNIDYLKTALAPLLSLPVANVSGWINSTTPVNMQGIKSFVVAPFAAPAMSDSYDVGDGARFDVFGTAAKLGLPGFQWTKGNMDSAFADCKFFNQNVQIPDGVTDLESTFSGCTAFNQNILIPNSVINLGYTFMMTNLNQNILIPNSVTKMARAFYYCNNFNQPNMYIFSQNVKGIASAFSGCHINNIHIPISVPKDTSNFMYNSLVNGFTGITFPASNIFNDLPVDVEQWPPFHYESVPSYWDDNHKYTRKTKSIKDEEGFTTRVSVWQNSENSSAIDSFYLSIDEIQGTSGNTYNVKLCNLTFDANGVATSGDPSGTLYKQDYTNIDSLYIANGQSYEPLLLGQNVMLSTDPVNTDCIYRSVMYNN